MDEIMGGKKSILLYLNSELQLSGIIFKLLSPPSKACHTQYAIRQAAKQFF